ncbi:uncharacterized protein CheA87a [Drosophila kikkawai]|uniref:Uncharacterized protein CheA87a n=1 Tax=Drosophila kikkawai TaxID=30033 RepID=A0A6P4I065_DROKI|nr:uncharacterized protein LOC108074097 [Drosophila kikkawai]
MASPSFGYLLVLATVLLFINPNEVGAKRTLRLYKLEKVVEKKEDLQSHLRIAEFEEGVLKVSGDLKQHVTIDNDWTIHFTISRADGHDEEYEEILDLPDLGVCDVMKTYYKEFLYNELKEYSNAPHPNTCPLPPEHYQLEDYPMDVHLLKKLLIPGYYRITSRLLHNDHIKLEYMAELEMKE